jgi:hypothetical protein
MYNKIIHKKTDVTLGYEYFIDRCHPLASPSTGKVYYHRHIASIARDSWLLSSEIVHHIDGNKLNNKPNNLVVVTKSNHAHIHKGYVQVYTCDRNGCDNKFNTPRKNNRTNTYCSSECAAFGSRVTTRPTKEELIELISKHSLCAIGRKYGVSDNAVRKWRTAYNIK